MKTQQINLWDAANTVTRRKFMALKPFIRKEEISWNNNPSFCLEIAEKEEQIKYKSSKRKETTPIWVEINEIENIKTMEKSTKLKVDSLEIFFKWTSISKTDQEKKREKTQFPKSEMKMGT